MTNFLNYTALISAILLTVASQISLKIGATSPNGNLNIFTLSGLAIFGLVTVLMVIALQAIPLKIAMAFSSLTFVIMPLAANKILGEEITRRKSIAPVVIVIGVIVFLSGG